MGKGGYNGGGTVVGPRSVWFSFKGGPPRRKKVPPGRDRTPEEESADAKRGRELAAKREKRGEEMLQLARGRERKRTRKLAKLAEAAVKSPFVPKHPKVPDFTGATAMLVRKRSLLVEVVVKRRTRGVAAKPSRPVGKSE